MRSSVYNRYWRTGGGAEKYAGGIAEVLARRGPVELLTHEEFDLDWLSERLRLDLAGCSIRIVDDSTSAVTQAAADADLFVNVSFMSRDEAPHERSLYVVHFPAALDGHLPPWLRRVARYTRPLRANAFPVSFEWGTGFHHREGGRRGVAWTDGDGILRVTTHADHPVRLRLAFGHHRPAAAGPADLRIEVDGVEVARSDLTARPTRTSRLLGVPLECTIVSPADDVPVEVRVRSSTFVPSELDGGSDGRTLGVPLVGMQIGSGLVGLVGRVAPALLNQPLSSRWAESYGAIASNSEFTRGWVARRWGLESEVLYPPVTLHERGPKERSILNVGRFFPAEMGHSKRQLELVEAFRGLVDGGQRGWQLHLVGGCDADGRSYLGEVEARAAGYPVVIHANASGKELSELYAAASIYWHASGFGVDPEEEPDVLEHFGISTVEAMSAGAVPVVLGVGGLVETVRHGVDGYHFQSLEGLAAMTRSLIADEALRNRMSASAEARARTFGVEAFDARLEAIVDRLLG